MCLEEPPSIVEPCFTLGSSLVANTILKAPCYNNSIIHPFKLAFFYVRKSPLCIRLTGFPPFSEPIVFWSWRCAAEKFQQRGV